MSEMNRNLDMPSIKKPYQKPQLCIYGDIRTITLTTGLTKVSGDGGGMGSPNKTA